MTDKQINEIMNLVDALSGAVARETIPECRGGYAKARAAIESALRAVPAIPEGWKLVPVEPTPEMVAAYLAENRRYWVATDKVSTPPNKWRTGTPSDATRESYRAMLSASPQAPQAVQPADWTKQTR